jgi:hypothetical protein
MRSRALWGESPRSGVEIEADRPLRVIIGLIAWGVAAIGVLLATMYYLYYYPLSSKPSHFLDSELGPKCADWHDSVCRQWEAPAGVIGWSPMVVVQAVVLAVIVLAAIAGFQCWSRPQRDGARRATSRLRILIAAWLILLGLVVVADLGIYLRFWSTWTGLPAEQRAGPETTFGSAAVIGITVVAVFVFAAVWTVVALVRQERKRWTTSRSPAGQA